MIDKDLHAADGRSVAHRRTSREDFRLDVVDVDAIVDGCVDGSEDARDSEFECIRIGARHAGIAGLSGRDTRYGRALPIVSAMKLNALVETVVRVPQLFAESLFTKSVLLPEERKFYICKRIFT